MTLGLVLAHATNNLLNDVVDYVKGVDKGNYFRIKYGAHIMELMTRREVAAYLTRSICDKRVNRWEKRNSKYL